MYQEIVTARRCTQFFSRMDTIICTCCTIVYMLLASVRTSQTNVGIRIFELIVILTTGTYYLLQLYNTSFYITNDFDFKIDGNINGVEGSKDQDFGYAYFRDELKGREGCNPDINIEMKDKSSNPHQTKVCDANDKYLGTNGGRDNKTSYEESGTMIMFWI